MQHFLQVLLNKCGGNPQPMFSVRKNPNFKYCHYLKLLLKKSPTK